MMMMMMMMKRKMNTEFTRRKELSRTKCRIERSIAEVLIVILLLVLSF
tara:strand:- start:767 stop:910 length:144 start_codon:yes stop_codon:yes gene_type:complete